MIVLPQQSGIGDEATQRFGLRVRNLTSGQHGIERVAQVVTRHLLSRLAQRGVEVVDATPVANLARAVDHEGLWRDRRLRVSGCHSIAIDDSREARVAGTPGDACAPVDRDARPTDVCRRLRRSASTRRRAGRSHGTRVESLARTQFDTGQSVATKNTTLARPVGVNGAIARPLRSRN